MNMKYPWTFLQMPYKRLRTLSTPAVEATQMTAPIRRKARGGEKKKSHKTKLRSDMDRASSAKLATTHDNVTIFVL